MPIFHTQINTFYDPYSNKVMPIEHFCTISIKIYVHFTALGMGNGVVELFTAV